MRTKGIVVIRFGYGLGTQMFYYALYRSLQLKGINVYLDDWFHRKKRKEKHEIYKLDYFGIFERELRIARFDDYKDLIDMGFWSLREDKDRKKLLPQKIVRQIVIKTKKIFCKSFKLKDSYYIEKMEKKPFPEITKDTQIYLQGLLQFTYKYFKDIRDVILDDFSFNLKASERVINILSDIKKNNSVTVHVRRGDFVGNKDLDICGIQYYVNAINYIRERVPDTKFYFFSNDLDYVKSNLLFVDNYFIVDNSVENHQDYFDLFLMTNTNHNIIPNSSFGWWGAWLNQNINKIVIVPELWRNSNKYFVDPKYVYPDEWVKIAVE